MFKNLKPYIQPTLQNTDSFTVSSRFLHVWSWKQQMFHISAWKKVSIIRTVGDSSALNQLTVEALIPTWWHFLNEDAVVEHFSQPRTVSAIKRSELTQRQSFLTSDVYFMTGEFKVAEGRLLFLLSSCCSTFKVCCSMYDTLRHTGAILWRPDCNWSLPLFGNQVFFTIHWDGNTTEAIYDKLRQLILHNLVIFALRLTNRNCMSTVSFWQRSAFVISQVGQKERTRLARCEVTPQVWLADRTWCTRWQKLKSFIVSQRKHWRLRFCMHKFAV